MKPTIDCPTARALNTWVSKGLKPAVGETGGGVKALHIVGSYACRNRNNARSGRLSERPNANRFHRDHFHFDTARYRSGSYCR